MTVLGIDYGRAHNGVSLGDTDTRIAMPLKTFHRLSKKKLFIELQKIITAHNIQLLVVGLPITWPEDRERSGMRQEVEEFSRNVSQKLNLPAELVDERFTSAAAKNLKKGHKEIDEHSLSAMLILQTYFDREY